MSRLGKFARLTLAFIFSGLAAGCASTTNNEMPSVRAPQGGIAAPATMAPQYRHAAQPTQYYGGPSALRAPSENALMAAGCGIVYRDHKKGEDFYQCPEQAIENLRRTPADDGSNCARASVPQAHGWGSYAVHFVCSKYGYDLSNTRPRYRR